MYPRKFAFFFSFFLFTTLITESLHGYAQGKDARITITCENLTIGDFFNAVWEQTRLQAFFRDQQLSSADRITVTFKDEPLDNVLAYLLWKKDLTWYYRDKIVYILPRRSGDPLLGRMPKSITRPVTGTVRDNNGAPIKNILVAIRSSFKGTRTDENGRFWLKDIKPDTRLETRSFLYTNKEVVAKEDTINIQLDPYVANLDPITVVGYSKRTLTGNIGGVKEEDITAQPISNPLFALQGRVPGLYITAISGLPGSSLTMRLRGRNSIESRTDPLIIYDGMPFFSEQSNVDAANILASGAGLGANVAASPLNLVNVYDIASISVLKDADATAIYGTRGANGVIVITGKTPKEDMKGMTLNVYSGIAEASHLVKYLNTQQYLTMRREALRNEGRPANPYDDYDLTLWDTTRYTNWQKTLIGGTGYVTNANMEMSAAGKTSSYRLSGLYRRESTLYPSKEFNYTKRALRFQYNLGSLNKKFNAALSGNYTADRNKLPSIDLTRLSALPPNTPDIYVNGALNFARGNFDNPYGYVLRTDKANSHITRVNGTFSYRILQGLSVTSTLGYGFFNINETQVNPSNSFYLRNGQFRYSYFADTKLSNLIAELQALWKKTIGKEQFDMLIGTTFQKDGKTANNYFGMGYTDDTKLEDKNASAILDTFSQTRHNYRYISWYAHIGYKHNDKYLLNITINRDGSTRLSSMGRYGNFGTIAAGWIFSRESWLIPNRILSFGKLRSSLGITGNDRWTLDESKTSFLPISLAAGNVSAFPPKNYIWEKIRKAEAGLDLAFFNDQLSVNFSVYHNRSTNQILTLNSYTFNGYEKSPVNYPAVVENKGMEVEIISNNVRSDKLTWITNFNISFPRTVLKAFPYLEMTSYNNYYSVGLPLDMFKGAHILGVDPKNGIYQFEDKNGDGITPDDLMHGKSIGPTLYGGIQNNIRWKGWEIEFLFRFVRQNNYNHEYASSFIPPGAIRNQPSTILDRWQHPGDAANMQQFASSISTPAGKAFSIATTSDRRITDASYIRMQSLSIACHLSKKWMQKIKIKSSKLFVQGQNLFTITKYTGLDPETTAPTETYPPPRVVTAGLQIAF
ncbi:TonB-linked outer membrane protein, SusC/RagA family [Chitinophaga rupis]|uniref:TonB-linked outer membrane protein, SusC/RagA family n=1 Tax=Chitinophaga rupis TaxID=573321 RepID=A0A1H7RY78_9BACT|nr:SusC/RagA family TonB-linked outer membrane protein [Chitinophaga rupis]SEL64624.1 TonB-linked outer membrane protein, SusC/RagA family [Chitinophaga rupis]